nr:immunoglobulin heavy chain junction region [Macaca mulatta]MOW76686.1 immunoglobulin heavy chain junction region [Macaca mulatta]MOW76982.1 immunoglobulin heavy chain junction region [Macaca mulatta]MOW77024.1 immunoglobulin heavy chain junction region [Macaca mulatta]MOW77324.1 immunoglobulin heavy chain junction region [Macaca mulatta]
CARDDSGSCLDYW